MERLSLLNDIIFKIVFGSESSRPVLRALLNALLSLSGSERIVDLEMLNPHLDKSFVMDKGPILDVKARDGQGRLYNIEVQVAAEADYKDRAVYYLTRMFAGQLEQGDPYSRLARTIGISLCDFNLFPEPEPLHSTFRLYDQEHGRELTDILELHFIELAKFRRDKPLVQMTPFEKWLHVLKFGELYQAAEGPDPEALIEEEGVEMALDAMRKACASDEVREMIEMRMKAKRDEASRMERVLREGLEKGLEEGLERGLEEGLERGLEKGLERGRQEGLEKGLELGLQRGRLDAAKKMRDAGLGPDAILAVTGLRPEDLDT